MFLGTFNHKLDAKGRLMIPAKFRKEIKGDELYLLRGFEGCVSIYTKESFEAYTAELQKYSFHNKNDRTFIRLVLSSVVELEIDKVGRLLLPKATIDTYKIEEEVVVVGINDHFEIWNLGTWNAYLGENEDKLSDIANLLGRYDE